LIVMTCCKPLVVTAGEPAGIGPELCVALASERLAADIVVLSDPDLLRARAALTGKDVLISEIDPADVGTRRARDDELLVLAERFPVSAEVGIPNPENAAALLTGLRRAVDGCCIGHFAGLVTAPLQKSVINDAGIRFSGHTEFLAELTGVRRPVMLLVAGDLRVALASTHLPLREVPDYLTQDGLREGSEDRDIIAPVVREFAQRGYAVRGPLPADTVFTAAGGHKDAIVAMYHDQGLPVLKFAGFGKAVNVTLGLPIVRTSVDHGTALDIAGKGLADAGSLVAAVNLAAQLAQK
jgi:4-hydroxythreonine-4-phosphate dehydrogenase